MSDVDFATNLRRLMARQGLSVLQVVERTGLDERTIKTILSGANSRPHARTLFQLAQGLGVESDELFQTPGALSHRAFDRQTNPLVDQVVAAEPALFAEWSTADFDELYSRFGHGGALTTEGTRAVVEQMNQQRDVHRKVALLLQTSQADVLQGLVNVLYKKIACHTPSTAPSNLSNEAAAR